MRSIKQQQQQCAAPRAAAAASVPALRRTRPAKVARPNGLAAASPSPALATAAAAAAAAMDTPGPTAPPTSTASSSTSSSPRRAAALKAALLSAVEFTSRGANTTARVRGEVEEAVVALEAEQAPAGLDYGLLEGAWRLVYTTAPDVIPIVGFDGARLLPNALAGIAPAPVVVGDVLQRFSRAGDDGVGAVENVIRFGVPPLTAPRDGVTFTVKASYDIRSPRRISLVFQEASIGAVKPSPALEALLAPALLPRGWWNLAALQGVRQASARFPFRSAAQVAAGRAVGAAYLLSYLDEDALVGRAAAPAGLFVFVREREGGNERP